MSSKEYVFVKEKPLYHMKRYFIKERLEITCIGGENMSKQEPKLVFVKTSAIPKMGKGRVGRDWSTLLAKIPEGESLVVPKELASGATVRVAVSAINKEAKKTVYTVTQRTVDETVTVYVTRN